MQMLLCAVLPNTPDSARAARNSVAGGAAGDAPDLLARAVADGLVRRHMLGQVIVEAAFVAVDIDCARAPAADDRGDETETT